MSTGAAGIPEVVETGRRPLLRLEHVTRSFGNGRGIFDTSLEVCPGQIVGVIGANGSGKSTLLRCATFFERIDSGAVALGDSKYHAGEDQGLRFGGGPAAFQALRGRALTAVFQ